MTQPIAPERTVLGQLSIYVVALQRGPAPGGRLFAWRPPLHRHLLAQARRDGIRHALSFHIAECLLEGGIACLDRSEFSDPRHVVCVQLVDARDVLAAFCMRQQAVLHGRALLFRPVERWTLPAAGKTSVEHPTHAERLLQRGAI